MKLRAENLLMQKRLNKVTKKLDKHYDLDTVSETGMIAETG